MAMENAELPYKIDCSNGSWSIDFMQGVQLKDFNSSILTEEKKLFSTSRECSMTIDKNKVYYRFPELQACIELKDVCEDYIIYDFAISNISQHDQRIRSVSPLIYGGKWNDEGFFTVSKKAKVLTLPAERAYGDDGPKDVENSSTITSFWCTAFHDPVNDMNFLAGIYGVPQGFVRYRTTSLLAVLKADIRVLQWECEVDMQSGVRGVRLKPGQSINTGLQCMMLWKGSFHSGIEKYGNMLQNKFGRRIKNTVPAGWCSWYAGYYENITQEEMLKNLSFCKEIPELEFFQVDMGWENKIGTKTLGEPEVDKTKFPGGMKELAHIISSSGLKPGIWIRPFKGWNSDDENAPSWAKGDRIDLSHPEARIWIRKLAGIITKEWGYQYIKFDFVTFDIFKQWGMKFAYSAEVPFKPYDDTITNIQMVRMGLEAIREGAGDECFLLGCNCLTGPALGLIDGNRIGDDVNECNWDKTYTMGVKSISPQYFLNGKVWFNDPDCIMLQSPITLEHSKMWGTMVSLSGQMGIVSTRMYELPPDRMQIMKKLFPVLDTGLRPVEIMNANPPEVWYSKVVTTWEEYAVIAFFNWSRGSKLYNISFDELELDKDQYVAYEFWNQEYMGVVSDSLRVSFEDEGCKVVCIRRNTGRPQVIGTNRHILQGIYEIPEVIWDAEQNRLKIYIESGNQFDLSVYVPEGYSVKDSFAQCCLDNGILRIPVGAASNWYIQIDFNTIFLGESYELSKKYL